MVDILKTWYEEPIKENKNSEKFSTEARYGPIIANGNTENVPTILIHQPGRLGLRPIDAMLALCLFSYKWGEGNPFPSVSTLAENLNVCENTIHGARRRLIKKGYLKTNGRFRKNQQTSNEWDLSGLIDAINDLIKADNA